MLSHYKSKSQELLVSFSQQHVLSGTIRRIDRRWTSMRIGWFDVVEEALKTVDIYHDETTCPGDTIFRASPVDISHADDFPAIGFVKVPEMKEILDALSGGKVAKIEVTDIRDAVLECTSWISRCHKPLLELDLVLFCYYYKLIRSGMLKHGKRGAYQPLLVSFSSVSLNNPCIPAAL
jgi:hypothetical protein